MSKQKINQNLECILKEYKSIFCNGTGTSSSFASRIRAIERSLMQNNVSLLDWLNLAMSEEDSYQKAIELWDEAAPKASTQTVDKSWKAAYHKLVLFVLGQYDADLYMALCDKHNDLELCKLVARHALFCTIEVADDVKNGKLGSKENKNNGGNDYFSWFDCKFQRKQGKNQQRGGNVTDAQGNNIQFHNHEVIFDDNTQANLAIKNAINEGLKRLGIKLRDAKFDGYMACHVWDDSCHDYHFHTSVFNLVLLPKSIGGLSDYNNAVKHLLQYESAMRFGVYPEKYKSPKPPKYYKEVDSLWRQPEEHKQAKANQNPSPLK